MAHCGDENHRRTKTVFPAQAELGKNFIFSVALYKCLRQRILSTG